MLRKKDLSYINHKIFKSYNGTNNDEPFERCYEPIPETYRGKESGNMVLPKECHFCKYKYDCWDNIQELPSKVSQAKEPPMVEYISLA